MARKTLATHPDHVRSSSRPQAQVSTESALPTPFPTGIQAERLADGLLALQLFEVLLQRDGGWLRVVPRRDEDVVYWKWKYTDGPHMNHYVMVRTSKTEVLLGLRELAHKLDRVDDGVLRPTLDRPYD
jgi:hypothetical protein